MSIIQVTQNFLLGQEFKGTLGDEIRFNKIDLTGTVGKIIVQKTDEHFEYELIEEDASVSIESTYFGGRFKIVTQPTGFELIDTDGSVRKYVSRFCLDNQHIIRAILEHLILKGENGFAKTSLVLRNAVNHLFSKEQNLTERDEIVETTMILLLEDGAVIEEIHQGDVAIALNGNTKKYTKENRYSW
jgi:hypothetical protein